MKLVQKEAHSDALRRYLCRIRLAVNRSDRLYTAEVGDETLIAHREECRSARAVALVGMHAFQVGEEDLPVESVTVLRASVLDHGLHDGVLVIPGEVSPTARACLFERHGRFSSRSGVIR